MADEQPKVLPPEPPKEPAQENPNPQEGHEHEKTEDEEEIEEVAKELNINLPGGNLPIPIKIIALLTLVGGLSILGSSIADLFTPQRIHIVTYLIRILTGSLFVVISYGLIQKQRWAIWLYSILVIIAVWFNPVVAVLPTAVVVYLYYHRKEFDESIFDSAAQFIISRLKGLFTKS